MYSYWFGSKEKINLRSLELDIDNLPELYPYREKLVNKALELKRKVIQKQKQLQSLGHEKGVGTENQKLRETTRLLNDKIDNHLLQCETYQNHHQRTPSNHEIDRQHFLLIEIRDILHSHSQRLEKIEGISEESKGLIHEVGRKINKQISEESRRFYCIVLIFTAVLIFFYFFFGSSGAPNI